MEASLVLENFLSRSTILPIIFQLSFIVVFFQMIHSEEIWEDPALSIGTFQKVQREVIYFPT